MNFSLLKQITVKVKGGLIGAFILSTLAIADGIRKPREWETTMVLLPEGASQGPSISGIAAQFGIPLSAGIGQQASTAYYEEIIRSSAVLLPIAKKRIADNPKGTKSLQTVTVAEWLAPRNSKDTIADDEAVRLLKGRVKTYSTLATGTVSVTVATPDPKVSVQIATAIVEQIEILNSSRRSRRATAEKEYAREALSEVERELRKAEEAETAYRLKNRSIQNSPELQLELRRLELTTARKAAVASSLQQLVAQSALEEGRKTPSLTLAVPPLEPSRPKSRGLLARGLIGIIAGLGVFLLIPWSVTVLLQRIKEEI